MTEAVNADMLHARVQTGYLVMKLAGDNAITAAEMRKALSVLFPDLFPNPEVVS